MEQKPSIGRVVHYRGPGTANGQFQPTTYPAIIVSTQPDANAPNPEAHAKATLFVMSGVGTMTLKDIPYSDDGATPSHWSWPPRV